MDLRRNPKQERPETLRHTYHERLSYGGDSDGQLPQLQAEFYSLGGLGQ
jgi:hypothetical protein